MTDLSHLSLENQRLLDLIEDRERKLRLDPHSVYPWLLDPCRVRLLIVSDGPLDFGMGAGGLRTLVEALLDTPGFYVRFELTLGHIEEPDDADMMVGDPRIARAVKRFKFDDPSHFAPDMYDQVWLFGIYDLYEERGVSPGGQPYPADRLGDGELRALSLFMDGGGGLFATGDHGELGKALGGSIPRARSMRLWNDTAPPSMDAVNEVSMSGPRRNDTNRRGHEGTSEFDDQSDDIPQTIAPRMYRRWGHSWEWAYPHPLLCGPRGVIRVLPDHPHEGECVEPADTNRSDTFGDYTIREYPPGVRGAERPLPQVIATSSVLAGTLSSDKQPTQAHTFGAICAYNGHHAGVGRVVTDATWHHFVNWNLIGTVNVPPGDPRRLGFLATAEGQAYLEEIKAYYRNLAVWLSRPAQLAAMNQRITWTALWTDRLLEAVLPRTDVSLDRAGLAQVFAVGRHARDVLGRFAGRCQAARIAHSLLEDHLPEELRLRLDPWAPRAKELPEPDPLPWFDPEPVLDLALGGAVIALRERFRTPNEPKIQARVEKEMDRVMARGVKVALDRGLKSMAASAERFVGLFTGKPPRP